MTQGTSTHGGGLSEHRTDVGHVDADGAWWRRPTGLAARIGRDRIADAAAPLQLLALGAISGLGLGLLGSVSWRAGPDGGSVGAVLLHLVALLAACTVAAVVALRPRMQVAAPALAQRRHDQDASEAPTRLLAQMHHELRTPLNAMIGFSEVMLRELHGPLGDARYQEYAAHISESGGRLLKASEDALAVAATMSVLVADRRALRRERLPVAALLEEAWAATAGQGRASPLSLAECVAGADIECDRQATSQALQHLLNEAEAHVAPGGEIVARTAGGDKACRIEIAIEPPGQDRDRSSHRPHSPMYTRDCLGLILARSLIEMQGATLRMSGEPQAAWSACIVFPAAAAPRRPRRLSATAGWRPAAPARREGSLAVPAAAARASARSPSAPPA
jgi:signal transduction histidine kinase